MDRRRGLEVEIKIGRRRLDREQVVEAALARLHVAGPADLTLRGVARDLGVYVNNVTHHARSREDLLRDAVHLALAAVRDPENVDDVPTVALALRAALLDHVGVASAAVEVGLDTTRIGTLVTSLAAALEGRDADVIAADDSVGRDASTAATAIVGAAIVESVSGARVEDDTSGSAFLAMVDRVIAPFVPTRRRSQLDVRDG